MNICKMLDFIRRKRGHILLAIAVAIVVIGLITKILYCLLSVSALFLALPFFLKNDGVNLPAIND